MCCNPDHQRGALILGSVILLLALVLLIASLVTRIGAADLRSLNQEIGRRRMLVLAESGLARASMQLHRYPHLPRQGRAPGWLDPAHSRWAPCSSTDIEPPCGDGLRNRYSADWVAYRDLPAAAPMQDEAQVRVHALMKSADRVVDAVQPLLISLVSEARSADASARAVAYQDLLIEPLIAALPPAPLMAKQLILAGEGSVVTNPNGLGPAAALSSWSDGDTEWQDGARSCSAGMLIEGACALAAAISRAGDESDDVLDVDGNRGRLPDSRVRLGDALERVLGFDSSRIEVLQSLSRRIDCADAVSPASGVLWWSTADCRMPADAVWGRDEAPVMLIVEGHFQAVGGRFHGLLILLSRDAEPRVLQLDQGFAVDGAVLANTSIRIQGDGYRIAYDLDVLKRLMQSPAAVLLSTVVPGSWRDFP